MKKTTKKEENGSFFDSVVKEIKHPEIKKGYKLHVMEDRGIRTLDYRQFYETEDGELAPTRKGVRLNKEQAPKLIALLKDNLKHLK